MTKQAESQEQKQIKRTFKGILLLFSETFLLFLLLLIALLAFVSVTKIVFIDNRTDLDLWFFDVIQPLVTNFNTSVLLFFTFLGNYQFLITGNLLLIFYFLVIKKHRWFAVKVPAIAFSSLALMVSLKSFFARPRPLTPLLDPAVGLSFPSGHAMSSVTFYGLLIYIVYHYIESKALKISLSAGLVILILLIGFSRIYIRVHYLTDVIAGYSIGILWLVCAIKLLNLIEKRTKRWQEKRRAAVR